MTVMELSQEPILTTLTRYAIDISRDRPSSASNTQETSSFYYSSMSEAKRTNTTDLVTKCDAGAVQDDDVFA